jgi:hypothetical protein
MSSKVVLLEGRTAMENADSPRVAIGRRFAPTVFKLTASGIFAFGALIHVGRMIVGLEQWQQQVFTPPVDIAFGLLIIVPAVAGVLSWRLYGGGWGGRIVFGFAMFLLIISVPLHLRTILTWSTEYLLAFPFWYSAIEVPMFAALSYMVTQLRFSAPIPASSSMASRT